MNQQFFKYFIDLATAQDSKCIGHYLWNGFDERSIDTYIQKIIKNKTSQAGYIYTVTACAKHWINDVK